MDDDGFVGLGEIGQSGFRRDRDRLFVADVRRSIAEGGFPLDEEQKIALGRAHTSPHRRLKDESLVAFVDRKLRQPDIRAALTDVFAEADMDIGYLLRKHREHIEGVEYEKVVNGEHGPILMRLRDKPNYAALRDVERMVLPEAPKQVQVDQRVLHGTIEAPVRTGPPKMEARLLGSARVEVGENE